MRTKTFAAASPNTANYVTHFIEMSYCIRSTVLLTRNLSFDSSQNGGVICRHVSCHAAELEVKRFIITFALM